MRICFCIHENNGADQLRVVCFCCDGVSFELSLVGTCVEDVNESFLNDLHVHYICQLYTMRHKFSKFSLIFKMQIGMKMK